MDRYKNFWAPFLLRIILGFMLLYMGVWQWNTIVTADDVPAAFADQAESLEGRYANAVMMQEAGFETPDWVPRLFALVQIIAGVLLMLGGFTITLTLAALITIALPAFVIATSGGLPIPYPHSFGLPEFAVLQYGETIMLSAGLLALGIGGAGSYSLDYWCWRHKNRNRPLTLVVPIKAGEKEALVSLLEAVQANIYDNPYIRFADDNITHFLRMFVITTPEKGDRLVLAATHHGPVKAYVEQLIDLWPGLDAIWSKCEGYINRDNFWSFVQKYSVRSPYWFTAFPNETVQSMRNKIAIREELERILDFKSINQYMDYPGLKPLLDRLDQVSNPTPLVQLSRFIERARHAVIRTLQEGFVRVALVFTYYYATLGEPRDFPRTEDFITDVEERKRYLKHTDDLEANVSPYQHNQFTVLAPIKPSLYRVIRLRAALFFGGYLAGFGFPPGELTGVFTIHFLHWVIIDDNQYGIVFSNYDGTWENYLGDFADKLNFGLDALFNNCQGYPPGGLQRIESWAHWIRSAQLVVPLYYSAYPDNTAIHLARDREVAELVGKNFSQEDFLAVLRRLQ